MRFGYSWMRKHVSQIKDLWNEPRNGWKSSQELVTILGQRLTAKRRQQFLNAIPQDWCVQNAKPLQAWGRVASCSQEGKIDGLFQISTHQEKDFNSKKVIPIYFISPKEWKSI